MKNLNRRIAVFLAVVMFFLAPTADITVMAEEVSDTAVTENESYQMEKSDIEESTEVDSEQTESQIEQQSEDQMIVSDGLLNYVGIDKPYLTSPDIQKIIVSYGDGTESVSEAKIVYRKDDGTIIEDWMSSRQEELFLFEHSFSDGEKGTYTLIQFVYVEDGREQTIDLQDIGVEAMFGVDETYPGYNSDSQDTASQEELDMSVVSMETDEVTALSEDVADAIASTEGTGEVAAYSLEEQTRSGKAVVVLDPGHGGTDGGAVANGLQEKDLTLKIAQYCKEELEQYSGITVYMTREDDRYLGDTTGDAASDLTNRVNKAKEWGADLLVSIHINSGGGRGVEIWYPNSNYKPIIGQEGEDVAQQILDELVKIGLTNRGIKIKNTVNNKYSDGSLQDYYGIIRRSKLAGFPGIIVEHAFIDNADDAAKLKDESFLKQCGIADATGIANYYGLSKAHWEQVGNLWKYNNGDGTYKTSQWCELEGVWYYFDANGIMRTGWLKLSNIWYYLGTNGARVSNCWRWINSKCYYFDENGCMKANTWIGDYYVDASGAWIPGKQKVTPSWKKVSGRWKYMESNGEYVKSSWLLLGSTWYHFDANGYMQTGWLLLDKWYYLEANGAMVVGRWKWVNGKCYYFDNNGRMAADTWIGDYYVDASGAWIPEKQQVTPGWKEITGRWKYMEANGEYVKSRWLLVKNVWYHFDANGYMQTGWLSLDGKRYYLETNGAMVAARWRWLDNVCYYFYSDGCMATDAWIDDYYVDANGAWIPDKQKMTDIMGISSVTATQLANFYKSMNKTYPSYYSKNDKEAKTIEDFCRIYIEECKTEGVRAEVAFAQAMVETGYLSFGGDVDISQYNFAGMGATGNGVKGNSFSTVRIGVRAQVQHLKCYASTEKLNGTCVDPRWGEWLRGKAPYVEWLSISNNPNGTGWAASATYADSIKNVMAKISKSI